MAFTKKVGMVLAYRQLAPTGRYEWLIDPADFGSAGGMVWRSTWNSSTIYDAGSVVVSNGVAYVATVSNVGVQPPNTQYWDVLPGGGGSGGGIDTVLSDINVTGQITGTTLGLGWSGELGVDRGGTGVNTLTAGVLVSPGGTADITTVTGNPSYLTKWDTNTLANSVLSESGANILQEGEEFKIQSQELFNALPISVWTGEGQYNSANAITTFGQIEIGKENGTDGNTAGYLDIRTRTNAGALASRLLVSSTGVVTLSQLTASKFIKTDGSKALISTDISASDIINGAALTKADDTNVTLTLGGSPTTALLVAASITAGWTGTLSVPRGGTGAGTANGALTNLLPAQGASAGLFLQTDGTNTLWAAPSVTGAALTRVDDTNVTLTLGGTPTTALLQATSITAGWSGLLSVARGGTAGGTANDALTNLLPSQGGNAGKVLSTNGTVTSWIAAGSAGTVTSVTIGAPAAGITQSGSPITASGTITLALANDLAALEGLSGTGIAKRTAVDTWALQSTVSVADGGTAISTYTTGDILYAASSSVLGKRAISATTGAVLVVAGGLPDWTAVLQYGSGGTGQNAWTKGQILYAVADNVLSKLTIGTSGQVLKTSASGLPEWAAAGSGTVTSVAVSSTDLSVSGSPITTSGTFTLNIATAAVTLAKMADMATASFLGRNTAATGVPEVLSMSTARTMLGIAAVTAKGDLLGYSTAPEKVPIGTDGFVLMADSAQALGLKWAPAAGAGTVTSVAVSSTDLSVTGSPITGAGTITLDINTAAVSLAKMANLATQTFIGRNTAGTGVPEALSMSTARTMLSINNVENTALSTWGGSTNLITLGTVTVGDWAANPVPVSSGGTGSSDATGGFNALSPLTTKGDLIGWNLGNNVRVPVGTDGQVLMADSTQTAGIKWAPASGAGTVTSVAMTVPSILSVAGSPITTSGTLALTLANQTANTGFMGPTSGGAATPTFRALVSDDIPNLSAAKITSGILVPSLGGTGVGTIALGDTLYGAGGNLWALLGGNITTAKRFLSQTGTGAVSAAPAWSLLTAADIGSGAALTAVNGTNVTMTVSAGGATALLGATSLTLGWTGQLGINKGGTGQSGANAAFNALAPGQSTHSGKFLTTDGANTSWSTIGVTKGGTGQTSWTLGDTLYASATNTLAKLAAGGTGFLMAMSSGGIPEWILAATPTHGGTGLFGYNQGDMVYASAINTLAQLPIGTAGQVLTVGGGNVPVWAATYTALTTQGDILYRNATVDTRLPAGTATHVLKTGGAGANPAWGQVNYSELSGTPPTPKCAFAIVSKSATYSATDSDCTIVCNFGSDGDITLPVSSVTDGHYFTVIRTGGAGLVTVKDGNSNTLRVMNTAMASSTWVWCNTDSLYYETSHINGT